MSRLINLPGMVAGVDEAGRGPLAGPVCAAAVIVGSMPAQGITDSKKLNATTRLKLARYIKQHSHSWSLGWANTSEIFELNILGASLLAMRRAVEGIAINPTLALVDGNRDPKLACPTKLLVGGDGTHLAIAAASILAKVARDRYMLFAHRHYPQYMFSNNKGYASAAHIRALNQYGACPIHRQGFAPVARLLQV